MNGISLSQRSLYRFLLRLPIEETIGLNEGTSELDLI